MLLYPLKHSPKANTKAEQGQEENKKKMKKYYLILLKHSNIINSANNHSTTARSTISDDVLLSVKFRSRFGVRPMVRSSHHVKDEQIGLTLFHSFILHHFKSSFDLHDLYHYICCESLRICTKILHY